MPRLSERQAMLGDLERLMELKAVADIVWSSSSSDSDSEIDSNGSLKSVGLGEGNDLNDAESTSSSSDDEEDMLIEMYCQIIGNRYLHRPERFVKSKDFINNFFSVLPPGSFRQLTRMDVRSFRELVNIIADHPIFQNNSNHPQAPVEVQLAVALDRFGHEGNGACLGRSLLLWGIGEGSMVNYTNRVMIALRDRLGNLISWPDEMERRRISASFAEKGFPGCVGLIDGTLIPLSQRPRDGGETYHDRKNRYSYNAQVVSDDRRKIIFLFAGMPGSCADITCLRKCKLYDQLHTGSWFSAEEYLLGDSGYTPLPRLVPGYRYSSRHRDKEEFNNCLAHARVVNEHTIGVLKSRWHSLRELRCQIKNRRCAKYAMRWISCCAILHNFLINKDEWTEEDDEIILEPPAQLTETDRQAYVKDSPEARDAGIRLRDRIQSICLAINRRPGGYLNRFQDFI